MSLHPFRQLSLKARVTLFSVAVLLVSMSLLALYAGRTLHEDMQRLLGGKQYSIAIMLANQFEEQLKERFFVLEMMARKIDAKLLGDPRALSAFMQERMITHEFFNGEVSVFGADGNALLGHAKQDAGHDTHDQSAIDFVLREGMRLIGRPVVCERLQTPVFDMIVPIRDVRERPIGVLVGSTRLDKENFIDRIVQTAYGQGGGVLVVMPQYRMIVTATDKSRILEALPPQGANEMIDRFIAGFEGYQIGTNAQGSEVLLAVRHIPGVGWDVGVSLPTTEAFAPIKAMQKRMLLGLVLAVMLGGLLIWRLQAYLLRPIARATRVLSDQRKTGGFPVPLPSSAHRDEIAQLIDGFNGLLESLKEREQALRESEASLQATLAALPDLIFEVGLDGHIHDCHPRQSPDRYFVPPQEFLGRCIADVLPPDAAAVIMAALEEAHESGYSKGWQYALPMPRGQAWYELSVSRKVTLSEASPLFVMLVRDITAQKQAEGKLLDLAASLEEQVEDRTRQLKTLTTQLTLTEERERRALAEELHDNLGQLLAAIKIQLSMLTGRMQRESIGAIMDLVEKADRAVRTVVQQWSPPILKVVGFLPALESLCADLQRLYGIVVQADTSLCTGALAEETQALLLRAIRELLINVAKHARVKRADLTMRCENDRLSVVVRDTGCGFDPDRHSGESSGRLSFGLNSIRERILALGGAMTIDSQAGRGTTVVLSLPCVIVKKACPTS